MNYYNRFNSIHFHQKEREQLENNQNALAEVLHYLSFFFSDTIATATFFWFLAVNRLTAHNNRCHWGNHPLPSEECGCQPEVLLRPALLQPDQLY